MLKENYYEYSLNFHSEQICAAKKEIVKDAFVERQSRWQAFKAKFRG